MIHSRFLLVRKGCPFCRQFIRVISKLNLRLPIDKRIQIIDCYEWEHFGLRNIPLMDKLEKEGLNEGFPFLFIDSIVIDPSPTTEQLKILLEKFLNEDLLYV